MVEPSLILKSPGVFVDCISQALAQSFLSSCPVLGGEGVAGSKEPAVLNKHCMCVGSEICGKLAYIVP